MHVSFLCGVGGGAGEGKLNFFYLIKGRILYLYLKSLTGIPSYKQFWRCGYLMALTLRIALRSLDLNS